MHEQTDNMYSIYSWERTDINGNTALMKSVKNLKTVKSIIEEEIPAEKKREYINKINNIGNTALHLAAYQNNSNTVSYLMCLGANPTQKNHLGMSAIQIARKYKNKESLREMQTLCWG